MKPTRILGGLLAAIAISGLASPGTLLAGKGGSKSGSSSPPTTPGNYVLTFFGPLPGGDWTEPTAMNNSMEIVGVSMVGYLRHAFLYSHVTGTMVDLTDQFVADGFTAPDGSAFGYDGQKGWMVDDVPDINDSGQIVCNLSLYNGGIVQSSAAARYTPGSIDGAPRLDYLASSTSASAINNQGDVVGGGFLWTDLYVNQDGSLIAKSLPHGSVDLNDRFNIDPSNPNSGQIQIIGDNRRFTVNIATLVVTDDFDIGTLFTQIHKYYYLDNYEKSINNRGDVASFSRCNGPSIGSVQACSRYRDGQGLIALGSYGDNLSWVGGMNNSGDIAGTYETSTGEWHLFLYSDALGGMTDLSTKFPGVPLANSGFGPGAINDYGEICGYVNNDSTAFLLIPQQ